MIIGVSGKARSGKGVLAELAASAYGATVVSFAAGVKEEVADFLDYVVARTYKGGPVERRHLYGEQADKEEPLVVETEDLPLTEIFDFIGSPNFAFMPNESVAIFTPRSLMQWWGTEYRRAQDENYWVKKALAKCTDPNKIYIIDDCRFENEAIAIKNKGGYLVRVERPLGPIPSNPDHPSEVALDNWGGWDVVITNSSSLECYHEMVRSMLDVLCADYDLSRS